MNHPVQLAHKQSTKRNSGKLVLQLAGENGKMNGEVRRLAKAEQLPESLGACKIMRFNTLKELGAREIEPLQFHPDCEKAYGRMWIGNAVLQLGLVQFRFALWHHGDYEITRKEVEKQISLKLIQTPARSYDVFWYVFMSEQEIWIHPKGWFTTCSEYQTEMEFLRGNCNYNFNRSPEPNGSQRRRLKAAGFILLLSRAMLEEAEKLFTNDKLHGLAPVEMAWDANEFKIQQEYINAARGSEHNLW